MSKPNVANTPNTRSTANTEPAGNPAVPATKPIMSKAQVESERNSDRADPAYAVTGTPHPKLPDPNAPSRQVLEALERIKREVLYLLSIEGADDGKSEHFWEQTRKSLISALPTKAQWEARDKANYDNTARVAADKAAAQRAATARA